MDYLEQIHNCGMLPCLRSDTPDDLLQCVKALAAQGFPAVEIDCSTDIPGMDTWEALFHQPEITVGARVCDAAQGMRMLAAGSRWITMPAAAHRNLTMPGDAVYIVQSIDEVYELAGAKRGGKGMEPIPLLCFSSKLAKEIAQTYPQTWLLFSGDWDAEQNRKRLTWPSIKAIRVQAHIRKGQANVQAMLCKRMWADLLELSLVHIGINEADEKGAESTAKTFAALLGMPYVAGIDSDFAGTMIEAMKKKGRGTHGHIGIATSDLSRSMFFARRAGFEFDLSSRKNDASGEALLYYLDQEIGGFAVHFIQK